MQLRPEWTCGNHHNTGDAINLGLAVGAALDLMDDAWWRPTTVVPGELGTKGGLKTDAKARVLKDSGEPIPGLYATGNCSASVMGHSYPGAGSTIGPLRTFGYVAARDAVGV